ncbi:MAG TPA: FtsQ-type POTRA domain-containing protein [Acidimicrobiia bacterium]
MRRRRLLILGVALAVLIAIAYGVSRSPLLAVDTLRVRGTSHLTATQVVDAAGVHDGDAMVWIDTTAAVDGMEALPYVRDATLTREWPDTVRITVHERTPAAWVDGLGGKTLVDRSGRVLETVEAAPPGIPQLLGAKVVPPPGGIVDAVGAARVAGALTGPAAAGTTSVEVTDHGIVLHLTNGPEVRMGEATQVAVKIRAALAVLDWMQAALPTYVDVSVPTNPVAG